MSKINDAVNSLQEGGIIAYPSEGVWGLGCDPFNQTAVFNLLTLKGRSVEKGLILIASSLEQINPIFSSLSANEKKRLKEAWPGPETWLLPDPDQLYPSWIKGEFATVAIRVSAHPVVKSLCVGFAGLLVSTSANPGNMPPAISEEQVKQYFPDGISTIVSGSLGSLKGPSVIKDLTSLSTLRHRQK